MNILYTIPKTASVSDLQRNYAELLLEVNNSQEPLFILKQCKTEAVLLSPQTYESMIEALRKYEELDALEMVKTYEVEKKAGKLKEVKDLDALFE